MTRSVIASVCVLGAALFFGGCNNQMKTENEQLRAREKELTTKVEDLNGKMTESQAQLRQAESEKETIARERAELQQRLAAAEAAKMQPLPPGGGNGGTDPRPRGDTVLTVAGDVLFAPGSATLTAAGRKELDSIARDIRNRFGNNRIRVEGYTDSDPIVKAKNRFPTNKALSQARADAVEQYLAQRGVPAGRMSAVGMGSANPKSTKAASRRVEIHILG